MKKRMPAPTISHCIVCEDVRFERRNLVSLMGIYGLLPRVALYLLNLEMPARFCCAFYGEPVSGKFNFTAEIRGPDGKRLAAGVPPQVELKLEKEKGTFFVAFWFPSVVFPKADSYTIALLSNGQECYTNIFRLAHATPDQRSSMLS
jgi:hypothetical protein